MIGVNVVEFEDALERHDLIGQIWGEEDDVVPLSSESPMRISVWGRDEVLVHEVVVRAEVMSETLEFIVVLLDGGMLA